MSRSTISTFKLFEMFPDEASARTYLEGRLWPNGGCYRIMLKVKLPKEPE